MTHPARPLVIVGDTTVLINFAILPNGREWLYRALRGRGFVTDHVRREFMLVSKHYTESKLSPVLSVLGSNISLTLAEEYAAEHIRTQMVNLYEPDPSAVTQLKNSGEAEAIAVLQERAPKLGRTGMVLTDDHAARDFIRMLPTMTSQSTTGILLDLCRHNEISKAEAHEAIALLADKGRHLTDPASIREFNQALAGDIMNTVRRNSPNDRLQLDETWQPTWGAEFGGEDFEL